MSTDESSRGEPAPAEPAAPEPSNGEPAPAEPAAPEPGYVAAMAELEEILAALEDEDPDVDMLATRVERAATLIEVCRRRITNASIQVERVVAALEPDGTP